MAIAVIIPEEERYAALVRHAAENDLLIVELQHLVLELRHDVANAEAATKIAQEATERLRAQRRQGIADIRELLERFEQPWRSTDDRTCHVERFLVASPLARSAREKLLQLARRCMDNNGRIGGCRG